MSGSPSPLAETLIQRLTVLVAHDTQNPTGDERILCESLAKSLRQLGGREVEILPTGQHCSVYARFGEKTPTLLINAHIDTVPANTGYTRPPLGLHQEGERLYGLGSADTKGAIAAALSAVALCNDSGAPPDGVALLFSGDEEHGGSAIQAFLSSPRAEALTHAIVCEPTGCKMGIRHRGIGSAHVRATSPGGHSSRADQLPSPFVILSRATVAMDAVAASHREIERSGFKGICLNIAGIEGFIAFNVIPSEAKLYLSVRPPPGTEVATILHECESAARLAAGADPLEWVNEKDKPPFATADEAMFRTLLGNSRHGDPGPTLSLDFWTEAALFSRRGIDAVVFGPGDIAQAHAADEYVTVTDLVRACETFAGAMKWSTQHGT